MKRYHLRWPKIFLEAVPSLASGTATFSGFLLLVLTLGAMGVASGLMAAESASAQAVSFNRDIRPILAENCFKCHGPDASKRKGKLGLSAQADSRAPLKSGDGYAIVPGDPKQSLLMQRITTKDQTDLMPPPDSGKKLTVRDIELLSHWISQGAVYQPHWSYGPLQETKSPAVAQGAWASGEVDRYLLAGMEKAGIAPAHDADRATLLRRITLDLTGLPPSLQELDDFLADSSAQAYDQVVDRLLASPRFGERMAVFWLDLVRYADSIGYHSDNPRNVSPYRDYVIKAFNSNLHFDRFTIEQLAGDLLPNPSIDQLVASGYNRLLMTTEEGGAQAKEYEAKNVGDRVRNLSGAWLGSTMGCCECHDHKYDPFSARDFYSLGAFFADVKEDAIGHREEGMLVPDPALDGQRAQLDAQVAAAQTRLDAQTPASNAAQSRWEAATRAAANWQPISGEASTANGTLLTLQADKSWLAKSLATKDVYTFRAPSHLKQITGLRLEVLTDPSLPKNGPGGGDNGNFVLNEVTVAFAAAGTQKPIHLDSVQADFSQDGWNVAGIIDGKAETGWALLPEVGKPHEAIITTTATEIPDGAPIVVTLTFSAPYANHVIGHLRLSLTGDAHPASTANLPVPVREALALEAAARTPAQAKVVADYYRQTAPEMATLRAEVEQAKKARAAVDENSPRCLITMAAPPRTVRVLPRGNWQDDSGAVVLPAVPHFLRQIEVPGGQRATRLDLARWLVSADNPLTARVFVDRVWQMLFGIGLVKTTDDFGTQGEWPSNPELLDHLAISFRQDWDIKALIRGLVTTHAYRLASSPDQAQRALVEEHDPFDRLLSHQLPQRLAGEFVRDNALAISGLLVEKLYGPSVKPYQPAGYWAHLNFPEREWVNDQGANAYRRGLYTWRQRTFLQPSLLAFDTPTGENCVADRVHSNTPQQALVLLNDPTYVEAARVFAAGILTKGGASDQARLTWAWKRALARVPRSEEAAVLLALLGQQRNEFAKDRAAATKSQSIGMAPTPPELDVVELASWTTVARAILNLHECITRY